MHLDGPAGVELGGLRAIFFPLVGHPADPDVLLDALDRAAKAPGVGGIDLITTSSEDPAEVTLTVRFDGEVRIVEAIDVAMVTQAGADDEAGAELWRRAKTEAARRGGRGLLLAEGKRFHPYHLQLDEASLLKILRNDGQLGAAVDGTVRQEGELVTVLLRAAPGPQYKLGILDVMGPSAGVSVERLRLDVGGRPTPKGIARAVERLRAANCELGFPQVQVRATDDRRLDEEKQPVLDLGLTVTTGLGPVRVVDVKVDGVRLPDGLLDGAGVKAGETYCRDQALVATDRVSRYLKDSGFPNALVAVSARPRGRNQVAVVVSVDTRERANVARVWFRGHTVTRDKVLRQLVSVKPGQRFQQSEIDRSVDNLRRSGLFRRVSHSVIESVDPGEVYVAFELTERDLLEVEFDENQVFLHNMDIAWPTSVEDATDGVTLRGGGQTLRLKGAVDHVGIGLRDPFLWSGLIATFDLDVVFHEFTELTETATTVQVGAGLTALSNQFEGVLLMFADQTVRDAPDGYDAALPFRTDRGGASAGLGLDLSLDLQRLDAERIAYLGFRTFASVRSADLLAGKPWTATSTSAALNLPLYRNTRGQHFVLQLWTRHRMLFDGGLNGGDFSDSAELYAHRMLTPRARGYAGTALRHTFDVPTSVDGVTEEVLIGHRATFETTIAVRAPLKWRRNAVRVFLDIASGGDLNLSPVDFPKEFAGLGVGLDFSLFDERLEGILTATLPLDGQPEAEYFTVSAGGSFN